LLVFIGWAGRFIENCRIFLKWHTLEASPTPQTLQVTFGALVLRRKFALGGSGLSQF
jgi:hypothetical protein